MTEPARRTARPALVPAALAALLAATGAVATDRDDWQHYGGGPGGSHYSSLSQINRGNVAALELAWSYRTGDIERHPEHRPLAALNVTPILLPETAGGSLVLCSAMNRVIALDPATGKERWVYDPQILMGPVGNKFLCRGVAYWEDVEAPDGAACRHRIFTATKDLRLIAVDAATGRPCEGFGVAGEVDVRPDIYDDAADLKEGDVQFSAPPLVIGNLVLLGAADNTKFWRADSPRGEVRAFDARTGKLAWTFDPIPRKATDPAVLGWTREGLEKTGGANVWTMMSADPERGLVFLPTATAAPNNFGGHRPGDNRYANSVVALRAKDGSVAWHFQIVHHDVWDLDLPAQPILVDLERDGRMVPVVIQLTKQGLVFVLHRETGAPVFPVEERPVPTDGVPGEVLSPTQPFPVRPAPLGVTRYTPDDAWGFTLFDRAACRDKLASFGRAGLYEPPSLEGTLMASSANNWGGAAYDPDRSLLVLPVSQVPIYTRLKRTADVTPEELDQPRMGPIGPPTAMAGTPYSFQFAPVLSPMFSPCAPPPWGELMALDLSGDTSTKWRFTLGTLEKLMPVPIPLPFGTPLAGGPTITAGGLVFIGASADEKFRAFDIDTGEKLWETSTPASAMATPMTYEVDGRQFVVVAAGGHIVAGFRNVSDYVVAYALPPGRAIEAGRQ
ncbi:MAG: pyrroloquinoline quinone-dependent dehydrogenase [Gammaproteobacteria bacterium]|nr:pyrroloquinoline quinone-dependent dehydrogenase [Gammaproteobacteria bacterium]